MKTMILLTVLLAGGAAMGLAGQKPNAYLDPTPEIRYAEYLQQHQPFLIFDAPDGSFRDTFVQNGKDLEFVEWRRTESGAWRAKTQTQLNETFGKVVQFASRGGQETGDTSAPSASPRYRKTEDGRWELINAAEADSAAPAPRAPGGSGNNLTEIQYLLTDDRVLEVETDNAYVTTDGEVINISTLPEEMRTVSYGASTQAPVLKINNKLQMVDEE